MITSLLSRLEELLDEENEALSRHDYSRSGEMSQRKSQIIFELMKLPAGAGLNADTPRAQAIMQKLERNYQMLGACVRAAAEISGILTQALALQQSDGTYGTDAPAGMHE